ncbi:MAG TPA: DUF3515 family protein [Pilimelia sp.]|nr:DUF3515 family protein [Pilimelia sp.]
MADPIARGAAWWATAVAVPLALLTGVLLFTALGSTGGPPAGGGGASAAPASPAPVPSTAVTLPAPGLTGRAALVCRALVARLPATVRGLTRREVAAGPEQNAAYGAPPITMTCGGTAPPVTPTDTVWLLNGVCWHQVGRPDGVLFTTVGREQPVAVTVPSAYPQPAQWAIDFSAPVRAAMPEVTGRLPTGCRP